MEPRHEEPKKKRFHIVKLEERVVPSHLPAVVNGGERAPNLDHQAGQRVGQGEHQEAECEGAVAGGQLEAAAAYLAQVSGQADQGDQRQDDRRRPGEEQPATGAVQSPRRPASAGQR